MNKNFIQNATQSSSTISETWVCFLAFFWLFATQLSPSKMSVAKELATNSHAETVLNSFRQACFQKQNASYRNEVVDIKNV